MASILKLSQNGKGGANGTQAAMAVLLGLPNIRDDWDRAVGRSATANGTGHNGGRPQSPSPGGERDSALAPRPTPLPARNRVNRVNRVAAGTGPSPTEASTPAPPFWEGSGGGLATDLCRYLADYVVLSPPALLAVAAWVMAARLTDLWDRFPHLAVTSPEGRCGKSRLLELLEQVCPNPWSLAGTSPAAVFRRIGQQRPTLLLDEAQSLSRRGSESSEMLRELFCGGIGRNAKVSRCSGPNHEPTDFPIYCPKVIALIGDLDGVLADRCLPIRMRRKTADDVVRKARLRHVEEEGRKLTDRLNEWAVDQRTVDAAGKAYDELEPFPIDNDRMAELLLPLQAALAADGGPDMMANAALALLGEYAAELDRQDREAVAQSPGVLLLAACREILATKDYLPTCDLINALVSRDEEPWYRWNNGGPISSERLAGLLRPYGIQPRKSKDMRTRGYYRAAFADAWARYVPDAANRPQPG